MDSQPIRIVQISPEELKVIIQEVLEVIVPDLISSNSITKNEAKTSDFSSEILVPKEVCEILKISVSTLWRYNKTGKLKPKKKIGRKIYYSKNEVMALING